MEIIKLQGRYFKLYPPENYGYAYEDLDLNLEHTAFIVCDVYGQFPSEDSKEDTSSGLEYLFHNEYDNRW